MAPTNHDQLRALLAAHGLPDELAERAVWGIALLPGGTGRSRLGGLPVITGPWPINNGCGLTHLASIALEELPDCPVREQLPGQGTLVFFADFSIDNEGWGPANGSEPVVEIMHILPGTDAAAAIPPEEPRGHSTRRTISRRPQPPSTQLGRRAPLHARRRRAGQLLRPAGGSPRGALASRPPTPPRRRSDARGRRALNDRGAGLARPSQPRLPARLDAGDGGELGRDRAGSMWLFTRGRAKTVTAELERGELDPV